MCEYYLYTHISIYNIHTSNIIVLKYVKQILTDLMGETNNTTIKSVLFNTLLSVMNRSLD